MRAVWIGAALAACCVLACGCTEEDSSGFAGTPCPAGTAIGDRLQCLCPGAANGLTQCLADGRLTNCDCSAAAQSVAAQMSAPIGQTQNAQTAGDAPLAPGAAAPAGMATPACLSAVEATGQSADCGQCLCESCDEAVITGCDAMCWGLIGCIGDCIAAGGADATTCATGQCIDFIAGADAATMVSDCALTNSGDICTARCSAPAAAGDGSGMMAGGPAPAPAGMAAPEPMPMPGGDCDSCVMTNCSAEQAAVAADTAAMALLTCAQTNACSGNCCLCGAICDAAGANYAMGPCAAETETAAGLTPGGGLANAIMIGALCDPTMTPDNGCAKNAALAECVATSCMAQCAPPACN